MALCSQFARYPQNAGNLVHLLTQSWCFPKSKIVKVSNDGHFGQKFLVEPNMTCVVFFRGWLLSGVIARHAPERFVLNGVAVVNATDLISHT